MKYLEKISVLLPTRMRRYLVNKIPSRVKNYLVHKRKKTTLDPATTQLNAFLKSESTLNFPLFAQPTVSIILLFYNRCELSFQCLKTLALGAGNLPFEVIIINNASTDRTPMLLDRIRGAKIIQNSENNGFGGGCNQAVKHATGKYLLFLNSDTELMPEAIQIMMATIEGDPLIGAVGGKLVYPDGNLQEAGSIIWKDGSCIAYGRNDDSPYEPEYSYARPVDFCSGALLLTPKSLFISMGGFDSRYAPAYYEDVDYCLSLWKHNYHVIFQPFAIAIHHEYGSSGSEKAIQLQITNRAKFLSKWGDYLENFGEYTHQNIMLYRERKWDTKKILVIDDRTPDYRLGAGYPRTYQILKLLTQMGYHVTFFPFQIAEPIPDIVALLQKLGIEVFHNDSKRAVTLETFLFSRSNYYDIIFASRPHNMAGLLNILHKCAVSASVIYDAEALFSARDILFNELNGNLLTDDEKSELLNPEFNLAAQAQTITTVSEYEKKEFVKHGIKNVQILSHAIEENPTPATFKERKDILFVGGMSSHPSPNEDAVAFFAKEIFPIIQRELNCKLHVVGTNTVPHIWQLESEHIHIVGQVDDLTPYYNSSRLFVIPTRYSAGIPLKLLEASAHGLPAVVTPLIARQIGWRENIDILIGNTPLEFAQQVITLYSNQDLFYTLRENVLNRIREEYSPAYFMESLKKIIASSEKIKK